MTYWINFTLILILLTPIKSFAQEKRALVIGLGCQKDTRWGKINGDKDVPYVIKMLKGSGFNNIRSLVNENATKAKIIDAFDDLVKDSQTNDIIYIHYSGHGQQITDVNNDEISDKWDESWIPYDAFLSYCDEDHGEKHLTDDEIELKLGLIRGKVGSFGKIIVVIDACHSGNSTYADSEEITRGTYNKFLIPSQSVKTVKSKLARERWLTISACEDFQVNTELKYPSVGKLTYSLYNIWSNKQFLSNESVLKEITSFMKNHPGRLEQTPKMTGLVNKISIMDVLKK